MTVEMRQAGHGDLYMRQVAEADVPAAARAAMQTYTGPVTLARGERTGHAHVLTSDAPIQYARTDDSVAYVLLKRVGLLEHTPNGADHGTRFLGPGLYVVQTEREYDPAGDRRPVID